MIKKWNEIEIKNVSRYIAENERRIPAIAKNEIIFRIYSHDTPSISLESTP